METSAPKSPPLIVFDRVSLTVDGRRYLDRAELEVPEGESLVISGPPGCGKSFILRLILGLPGMRRDAFHIEGDVLVDGQSVFDSSPQWLQRLRRHVGSVLRGGSLIENMDIRRNIMLPLNYHYRNVMDVGDIDARCDALLDDMGLRDVATPGRRPVTLNRLERMYTALARALINLPHLLLIDEPTAGLTPEAARCLARFCFYYRPEFSSRSPEPIEEMASRPMTRIVTAVDLERFLDYGHRFAILVDGQLEILGTRDDVVGSSDPRVLELLSSPVGTGDARRSIGALVAERGNPAAGESTSPGSLAERG